MNQNTSSSHPVLKAAVGIGAVVLVIFVVMSVVSFVVGAIWTLIEIALLVAVTAGVVHMARRHHQLARGQKHDALTRHSGI